MQKGPGVAGGPTPQLRAGLLTSLRCGSGAWPSSPRDAGLCVWVAKASLAFGLCVQCTCRLFKDWAPGQQHIRT